MQTDIGAEHYVLITPVRVRVAVINAVYGAGRIMEKFQVNYRELVTGEAYYFITRHSRDGYVGQTVDTVYMDGSDTTDWCLFAGTHKECEQWIKIKLLQEFIKKHPERVQVVRIISLHAEAL